MCRAFGKRLCVKHNTQFSDLLINPDVPECFQTQGIRPNWMNWWSKWLTNSLVHDSGSPRRSWILTSVWGMGKPVPVVWVKCVVYHWTYVNIYHDIAGNLFWVGFFFLLLRGIYISKCLWQKLRIMNSNIRKHEIKKTYVIRVSHIKA